MRATLKALPAFLVLVASLGVMSAALDAPHGSALETAFADAKGQAEQAIAQARRQSNTTPTPERAA